jgi:hypothetical protein
LVRFTLIRPREGMRVEHSLLAYPLSSMTSEIIGPISGFNSRRGPNWAYLKTGFEIMKVN